MTGRVLAVIPARYGSERFPGKPLASIAGTPMIVRVLRNVLQARTVDRVVVATDDERIAEVVAAAGGEAVMTPSDLPSGSDRVWAVAATESADIVVNVQGDEPLLPSSVVDALVGRLRDDPRFDVSTPVVSVPRHAAVKPDVVTVAREDSGAAWYFSRSTIPFDADPVWRHLGVYAYHRAALEQFVQAAPTFLERTEKLEQLRLLGLGLRIVAVETDVVTIAVDRPGDVASVERMLERPGSDHAIELVVLDVDGVLTDGRIRYLGDAEQLLDFDVKDGYGIVALLEAGIEVAVISARDSSALRRRAAELGIRHVRAGVPDKAAELEAVMKALNVEASAVCVLGDDDPDVALFERVGLSAAPSDASPRARANAALVLQHPGGRGAVREFADWLLDR